MLLLIIKKLRKNGQCLLYFFTCSLNNDIQVNSIIQKLSEQIDHYNDTMNDDEKKNIKILICKDNIELYRKKDLLLHECNSPYYVFLDENDDVYDTYWRIYVEMGWL